MAHCAGSASPTRPHLAARAGLSVRLVVHAQLHVIPRVRLPSIRHLGRPFDLRRPWLELELLRVPVEHQRVALSRNADIRHLPPPGVGPHVGLDGVVGPVGRADERAHPFEDRVVGRLLQHLLAVERRDRILARRGVDPAGRRRAVRVRVERLVPRQRPHDARARLAGNRAGGRLDDPRLIDRGRGRRERAGRHRALQPLQRPGGGGLVAQEPSLRIEQSRPQLHGLAGLEHHLGRRHLQERRLAFALLGRHVNRVAGHRLRRVRGPMAYTASLDTKNTRPRETAAPASMGSGVPSACCTLFVLTGSSTSLSVSALSAPGRTMNTLPPSVPTYSLPSARTSGAFWPVPSESRHSSLPVSRSNAFSRELLSVS